MDSASPNPAPKPAPGRSPGHVARLVFFSLLCGLPAVVVVAALPWFADLSPARQRWVLILAGGWWLAGAWILHQRVVAPLNTLANVLSGLREGDYTFRSRGADPSDPLGQVLHEVNTLSEIMRQQRLGALEATTLLRTVMAEIDVAVFAFDSGQTLRLVNRAGERLLNQPSERLLGRSATELGLSACLEGEGPRTVQMNFGGASGRWSMRRQQFRQGGLPLELLVLSDLSRELREEERMAWQRLVRVLGHELNNSLAPVKSIAGSLETLVQREPLPSDWREDVRDGLRVIGSRAEALTRFVTAYAQLAKLPKPRRQPVEVEPLLHRVVALENRVAVDVLPGTALTVQADADQLEQLLINLLRNAADATIEYRQASRASAEEGVRLSWQARPGWLEILIEDGGAGLANTANLFVPFFTTKPKGSGIGLVLSRQIAEGHGGSLTLENRPDTHGCRARLLLPLQANA